MFTQSMKYPWRLVVGGGVVVTATAISTFWINERKTSKLGDSFPNLSRLHKEIRPWNYYWDVARVKPPHSTSSTGGTVPTGSTPRFVHSKVIIFVRHGQYNMKTTNKEEKVLTDLGWHQAYQTGCYLRRLGIKIDRIIHSNLIRARQTTAALLMGLSDHSDDTLLDVPTLVNLSAPYWSALQGDYSANVNQIDSAESDVSDPNFFRTELSRSGPSLSSEPTSQLSDKMPVENSECVVAQPYKPYPGASFYCQESQYLAEGPPPVAPDPPGNTSLSDEARAIEGRRLEDGFRFHINRRGLNNSIGRSQLDDTIVFVGHANVFRYWLCRALQLPPEAWLRIQLYHGSVSWLELVFESDPNGACVVTATRIGEVGHMPKELLSR